MVSDPRPKVERALKQSLTMLLKGVIVGSHSIAPTLDTRCRRISAANIGPNRFHQSRAVSWRMSIPRSKSRSSTLRDDNGNRTYIITTNQMTSGDELKYRNGLSDFCRSSDYIISPPTRLPDPFDKTPLTGPARGQRQL